MPTVGIRIDSAHIKYAFTDETGEKHENDKTISFGGYGSWIALARTAFVEFVEPPPSPAPAYSDTTYISLIDPNIGPHKRLYSMSRKIVPGDIERFHIMVGAPKSCRLRLKFKFFVDKDSVESRGIRRTHLEPTKQFMDAPRLQGQGELTRYGRNKEADTRRLHV